MGKILCIIAIASVFLQNFAICEPDPLWYGFQIPDFPKLDPNDPNVKSETKTSYSGSSMYMKDGKLVNAEATEGEGASKNGVKLPSKQATVVYDHQTGDRPNIVANNDEQFSKQTFQDIQNSMPPMPQIPSYPNYGIPLPAAPAIPVAYPAFGYPSLFNRFRDTSPSWFW